MKMMQRIVLAMLLLVPCIALLADQFIAPKKKTQSISKSKEQCAQELGNQLEHFARIMQLLGNIQSKVLEHTYALLEDDKDNPLQQKNGAELQACSITMQSFNDELEDIEKQLQTYACFLKNLK